MMRLDEEKKTVRQMIEIFCRGMKHTHQYTSIQGKITQGNGKELCEECSALFDYACQRLEHCRFLNEPEAECKTNKPTCRKCPVHCYKPVMKERMRMVMRYAGPRMMLYHPIAAIRHLIRELK